MENLNDDDTCVFEPAVVKLTPYDRRRLELRALQEKRDELLTHPGNDRRIAELGYQIENAVQRFEKEKRRSTDDDWRRLRDIDDWRSRSGRELRNASRRKVRSKPNEDLSHLTNEQKIERKRFQRADANFCRRLEKKGLSQADIQAALLVRQQQRDTKRDAEADIERQLATNPAYGMF